MSILILFLFYSDARQHSITKKAIPKVVPKVAELKRYEIPKLPLEINILREVKLRDKDIGLWKEYDEKIAAKKPSYYLKPKKNDPVISKVPFLNEKVIWKWISSDESLNAAFQKNDKPKKLPMLLSDLNKYLS